MVEAETTRVFSRMAAMGVPVVKSMQYIYSTYEQIGFAKQWDNPGRGRLLKTLRKKLREGLRQGKEFDLFPLCRELFWVYEEAYPMKPFWWLYGKLGRRGERQK